jgi:uncharacterized protein YndB with AHSA1/START domain
MSEPQAPAAPAADREIVITRVFAAPRELVWKAWTDPRHVARWWGPRGFTTTTHEMDIRPGGAWRFVMHGPDGTDYKNRIVFLEVAPSDRLTYRHAGEEEHDDVKFQTTVTFADEGGKTRLTMRMTFETAAERNAVVEKYGAIEGGQQTLERLGEHLAGPEFGGPEFVVTRTFDAPRDLVWKAWTDAGHLVRWFGPKGFTTSAARFELRPGGTFHYRMQSPDGREMWGKWVFREIAAPGRLVYVSSFSDEAGNTARAPFSDTWPLEVLSTVTFDERDGKTTITLRGVPLDAIDAERKTFEDMFGSMRQGWAGTLDQLAAHLAAA